MKIQSGKRLFFLNNERITVALIFLLALVMRVLGIASRPIWYDEAFAVLFSEKGLNAMLRGTLTIDASGAAADIHPLGYYTVLWGWMKIFGESLVSVRTLSIIFGLLTVILAYMLIKAIFNYRRLALVGMLGVAIAPFMVHYSQEIRMYSMLALCLTGATYALWQGLHSTEVRWWIWFAVWAALAQYTQNLAAFYLISLALTPVFLGRWDKIKATCLAGMGAIVLYLPWLVHLPAQFAKVQNAYWVDRPTISTVFNTLLSYVTNLPVDEHWLLLALVVTFLTISLAGYQTYLALRRKLPGARRGLWLAYLAFIPPALAFIVSQWRPIYIERAFLASGVMFWLWLVWALISTGLPRFLQIFNLALLTAGIVLGLATHLTYTGFPYGPYAALDISLESRVQPGDVIIHSNKLSLLPAIYYDRTLKQHFIADPPGSGTDTLAPATQQVLGVSESTSLEDATAGAQRVWFIIFQKSIDEATSQGLITHPHITWLDTYFHRENIETWGPILLYIYTR